MSNFIRTGDPNGKQIEKSFILINIHSNEIVVSTLSYKNYNESLLHCTLPCARDIFWPQTFAIFNTYSRFSVSRDIMCRRDRG